MAKQRYCRVCGEPFMARRFDALTCTSTCWARKARGHDLAYLANLPDCLADVRRSIHEGGPRCHRHRQGGRGREARGPEPAARAAPGQEDPGPDGRQDRVRRPLGAYQGPRGRSDGARSASRSGLPLSRAGQPVGECHSGTRRMVATVLVDGAPAIVDRVLAGGQVVVGILGPAAQRQTRAVIGASSSWRLSGRPARPDRMGDPSFREFVDVNPRV